MKREVGRLNWVDFLLSGVSNCLALYAMSFGLRKPLIGVLFISITVIGTLFSSIVHRYLPPRVGWVGAALYFGTAVACMGLNGQLNQLLPEEGFDRYLLIAGGLAWMLTCCSLFLWREAMLLFQAVPAIALFGLVGAFDTLSGAPFAFFGFLLCFATMFARSNNRTMMKQAQDAGFASRESEGQLISDLKQGPWRFMAGAEWALGSALAIVLFSFLGAPVVQGAMQGVAGQISVAPPPAQPLARATDAFTSNGTTTTIGNGPRGTLSTERVFRVFDGVDAYYRVTTFGEYTGRGWAQTGDFESTQATQAALDDPKSDLNKNLALTTANHNYFRYRIRLDKRMSRIPVAGAVRSEDIITYGLFRPDGTLNWPEPGIQVNMASEIPTKEAAITNCPKGMDAKYTRLPKIPARVTTFAKNAAAGQTDFERATALCKAIGTAIVYDLQAEPVPIGVDPIEHTLFTSKNGYCDLYASAMVVCARSVGLPARYATGFYPVHQEFNDGTLTIRESEAHAWAEIYFEGIGWVEFDPTEYAVEGRDEIGSALTGEAIWNQFWFRILIVALIGTGLFFTPRLIKYVRSQSAVIADTSRIPAAVAFKMLYRGLEKVSGRPKRPSQTANEYLQSISHNLDSNVIEAQLIADRLSYGMFAKVPLEAGEVQSLREQISGLLPKLRK